MKLATFTADDKTRIGVVDGDDMVDLSAAAPSLPCNMRDFIAAGPSALATARDAVADQDHRMPMTSVRLEAPVPNPSKLLAVGLNYGEHIAESGMDAPTFPLLFNKQVNAVNGPFDPIVMPHVSEQLDYEGELAVVIGRRCRYVSREDALSVIAGYTVINDVSVRDWQRRTPTMTLGKSFDTHAPFGPYIVTADEIPDPQVLSHRTFVNGEKRQDSNTKHMIFGCADIVHTLSQVCTLEVGDVIAMGTPEGVAMGFDPPKWLKVGDRVRIEIDSIGTIEQEVVAEPDGTAFID
jgi:2-keto-4-pentenoate hydratase/2-oxohepta-3-ene-1,7-dioic acid hydratase in catechol pathway